MASAMIDPSLDMTLPTSARDHFCLISTLRKLVAGRQATQLVIADERPDEDYSKRDDENG